MNFHVASRGVAFNFDFPARGSCLNCSNKIIKKILARSTFPKLFLENVLLSLLFTLIWHLRDINTEMFPRSLRSRLATIVKLNYAYSKVFFFIDFSIK